MLITSKYNNSRAIYIAAIKLADKSPHPTHFHFQIQESLIFL